MSPAEKSARVHAALNSGNGVTAWIPMPPADLTSLLRKGAVDSRRQQDGTWTHRPATRENTATEGDAR
jgi:hypothetical protein